MPRWKLNATSFRGGFALQLMGDGDQLDGDLGRALHDADAVDVEMKDGRSLPLFHAVLELINARRVIGFVVLIEQAGEQTSPEGLEIREWLH